jgi:hypothetical protein
MAIDKKVLGPDMFDTRLRNQFLKTNKIAPKDVAKSIKDLPDDSEWATWVPLETILKEDEDDVAMDDLPATH